MNEHQDRDDSKLTPCVRRLDRSDAELLRDVRLAALEDSPREFGETLSEARAQSREAWSAQAPAALVAALAGRNVGMAFAFEDAPDGETGRLGGMWVAPDARRLGVASCLVEAALRWARAKRKQRVQLWVVPGSPAEKLYLRARFIPTGTQRPFPGDSLRSIIEMQLDLRVRTGTT